MKLYEINDEILRLTDQITIDEETGEVLCDIDSIMAEIDSLRMERRSILEYLAKLTLNLRSEAAALKAEEVRLRERRARLEKKESRLLQILDRECAGENTDLGIAAFRYRRTSRVEVTDAVKAVNWLKRRKYVDCYHIPVPEVAKNEVKKLFAAGTKIPGCEVIEDRTYSLR